MADETEQTTLKSNDYLAEFIAAAKEAEEVATLAIAAAETKYKPALAQMLHSLRYSVANIPDAIKNALATEEESARAVITAGIIPAPVNAPTVAIEGAHTPDAAPLENQAVIENQAAPAYQPATENLAASENQAEPAAEVAAEPVTGEGVTTEPGEPVGEKG